MNDSLEMLKYFLLLACLLLKESTMMEAVLMLTCDKLNSTCQNEPVTCECQGDVSLTWTVTTISTPVVTLGPLRNSITGIGGVVTEQGYTAVLSNVTEGGGPTGLTSILQFNISENVNMSCRASSGTSESTHLHIARSPSPPHNLKSMALNDTAVPVEWDPPLSDGGVAITHYLISVNMSQQVVVTDTTTTLTLDSTGQHLIEISAVNQCGIVGASSSTVLDDTPATGTGTDASAATLLIMESTVSPSSFPTAITTAAATLSTALLSLNAAAVVGVAIAILVAMAIMYVCGLLTGLLVQRGKNHTHSSGDPTDLSAPTYEQVLPPTQTSIALKENEAYGQFRAN